MNKRNITSLIACKKAFLTGIVITFFFFVSAQAQWKHGRLKVTADGHYLQYEDGTPFFWLGDTGWELFHRLSKEEIETYLENRRQKGFNVIQAVVLAEFDGLKRPNYYGELPLKNLDPGQPNEKYFELIDWTLKNALQKNMFIGLLPTWGDKVTPGWGTGPVIFDSVNAYAYGKWMGNRYKDYPNIIWILGGDRPALTEKDNWLPVWRAMAKGITEATRHQCIITYHPWGGESSTSQWIHNEPWPDINMMQSGHGAGHDVEVWEWIARDRALQPVKPTLDAEPNYEDHPVNPWPKWNPDSGYFRAYDVRKQIYRSVFAGACGVTYGHHAVWQFMSAREELVNYADRGWLNAIDRPGAFQAGYLKRLIESRPMLQRIPDENLIADGQGSKGNHIESFHAAGYSYAMIYMPVGKTIRVNTSGFKHTIIAWWFNPRDASVQKAGAFNPSETISFTSPTTGMENDWVLVLDDSSSRFKEPATEK
ncbi:glycoside hydrolase family 140 protein [Parafilimonas sp.]|uniref:glycoside hydrolase family 140 protein n=1 Tax=Parafilimonas sp. TaxID=1969739 RepID=UPI0039E3BAA1